MSDEIERMLMNSYHLLFQHLTGGAEENHSKSQSEWLTSRVRFELKIY
jgi:hypothetical protein